jgi:protein gp37
MKKQSTIQWTQYTGGPWLGCSEVSAGCAHCYARELMKLRLHGIVRRAYQKAGFTDWDTRPVWGEKAPRVLTKGFWNEARRVNAECAKAGTVASWFPSMIDWLDQMPAGIIDQEGNWLNADEVLVQLIQLTHETPNIRWLLLTKRPGLFPARLTAARAAIGHCDPMDMTDRIDAWLCGERAPYNIRVGATVENQEQEPRIAELIKIPARVRFLSIEPMLGPVKIWDAIKRAEKRGEFQDLPDNRDNPYYLHWVIFGGESGPGARPCHVDWIRDGLKQCNRLTGVCVPAFVKQLGAKPIDHNDAGFEGDTPTSWPMDTATVDDIEPGTYQGKPIRLRLRDKKGGDPEEWPADLRVREFPEFP